MKRILQSLCLVVSLISTSAYAQEPQSDELAAHMTGLIDMAHVFNHYEKFAALKAKLQAEIEKSDADAQAKMAGIKQTQLQLTNGSLQGGSPEFTQVESQLLKAQAELETFRLSAQREFLRKEADVYKTVYLDVQDAVTMYAEFYKFTLIMRFNRESVADVENPRDVINGMNRQVIYHRSEHDITEPILEHLNNQWRKQPTASATPNPFE